MIMMKDFSNHFDHDRFKELQKNLDVHPKDIKGRILKSEVEI
jgi:hypothetical protein